ncbi:hypothetical protein B0H65DRAFT_443738 [Neurospora tetraspora]|uniref:Uncharacterized protein n=1 Tax=Neurospora tetraspora TaxID=94610 RepID=A0AAE0JD40_9PEZI|nr:hypothetical protein B0H65DRAFT_443738 [Neurospora tetraspora]
MQFSGLPRQALSSRSPRARPLPKESREDYRQPRQGQPFIAGCLPELSIQRASYSGRKRQAGHRGKYADSQGKCTNPNIHPILLQLSSCTFTRYQVVVPVGHTSPRHDLTARAVDGTSDDRVKFDRQARDVFTSNKPPTKSAFPPTSSMADFYSQTNMNGRAERRWSSLGGTIHHHRNVPNCQTAKPPNRQTRHGNQTARSGDCERFRSARDLKSGSGLMMGGFGIQISLDFEN